MPKSNLHYLSHEHLLSGNQGELLPIGLMEALPGDKFQHSISALIRVQPLLAPVMHKCTVTIKSFFVPFRLCWTNWEDFITGGADGLNSSAFPYITSPGGSGFAAGSLADYLGIPTGVAGLEVSAIPFRAYALIWNNYFRDQNLQTELVVSKADGSDTTTNTDLQFACWEKDYFTSARPYPQLGTDVSLPLTGDAPVRGIGFVSGSPISATDRNVFESSNDAAGSPDTYLNTFDSTSDQIFIDARAGGGGTVSSTNRPNIYADLSDVTAATVNDLRLAAALQRYKENLLRFGHNYWDRLRQAFQVPLQDARLQLPEYLGGGRQVIQFSEVLQTAEGTDPVGEMRGHGIAAMRSNKYRRYIPEHGYIMSFICVRPKTVYMQGLRRTWNRRTKEDFFQPELAHIGQQEILKKEIYAAGVDIDAVWAYQDRHDEYRRQESIVCGEFRDTLKYWHMAREFSSEPALNADFVKANPTDRIYASNADQLYIRAIHSVQAKRKVPKIGTSYLE